MIFDIRYLIAYRISVKPQAPVKFRWQLETDFFSFISSCHLRRGARAAPVPQRAITNLIYVWTKVFALELIIVSVITTFVIFRNFLDELVSSRQYCSLYACVGAI